MKMIILAALTILVSTQTFAVEIKEKECKRYLSLKREQGKKVVKTETVNNDEVLLEDAVKSVLQVD